MQNETLSREQAKKIIDELSSFTIRSRNLFVDKSEEFAKAVSKVWEDNVAVDYVQIYKGEMVTIIDNMRRDYLSFVKIIEEICNKYARAGNMPPVHFEGTSFSSDIDVSAVKNHFDDEFETFGFLNPKTSVSEVLMALNQLSKTITNNLQSFVADLKGIRAFGNADVQRAIINYGNNVYQSVIKLLEEAKKGAIERIDRVAREYSAAGTEAITTASQAIAQEKNIQPGLGTPESPTNGTGGSTTDSSPMNSSRATPVVKPSDITGKTDVSAMIE